MSLFLSVGVVIFYYIESRANREDKMAEMGMGKGVTAGKLASNVQKKLTRAQEKVMQKLGKADETRDVAFEEGVINFNKQYTEGSKLQKDLRVYLAAVQTMHESSKNLKECLSDMYEPEWYGKDDVDCIVEVRGHLYLCYKSQINFLLSLAEDELERAQKVFEEINEDLQEELPSLWNSRVGFYVSTFQSMAGFEEKFHKEMGKLDQNLYDVLVKLERQDMCGSTHMLALSSLLPTVRRDADVLLRPAMPPRPESSPCRDMKPENIINLFDAAAAPNISVTSPTQFDSPAGANLLDMDLTTLAAPSHGGTAVSSASQAISWDTWEPEETPAPPEEPQGWDDDGTLPVRAAGWDDDGTLPVRAAGWDDDGTLPVRAAGFGDDVISAATAGWDDDGSLPVRVDDSWGDDGVADAAASAAVAESEAAGWDDEEEEGMPQADTPTAAAEAHTPTATAAEETPAITTVATNGTSEVEMPPGFLFKVTTMHDYAANDSDELEMKAGDIVLVVAFDNPEEQDEGWLMGMKEGDWIQNKESAVKGVFPENFTSRL
nr:unnamed protein product [Salmo salar]|eukprot:XP_014030142.1 PREDICTED: myc box-dependent-interacting protein 1-like [Salmo salar]